MKIADLLPSRQDTPSDTRQRHVVPHRGKWAVKKEGSRRATAVFGTKTEALEYGIGVCRHQDGVLVIHRRDGTVQDTRDYAS